jgi:hypothetical protein
MPRQQLLKYKKERRDIISAKKKTLLAAINNSSDFGIPGTSIAAMGNIMRKTVKKRFGQAFSHFISFN